MTTTTDIENKLLNLSDEEVRHAPHLVVNTETFRLYHIRLEKPAHFYSLGFRFLDFPAHQGTFFAFLPNCLSIPKRGPYLDGNYLKWVGYDNARRKPLRLYFIRENFETLFQIVDMRLKPAFHQFLLASYGRLNPERDLPRQTRTYQRRDNSIRRFFDHPMFEPQLLYMIRDLVYHR